jgi:hypothetical protein
MKCKTCQNEATVFIEPINVHLCASCLEKIDARIKLFNATGEWLPKQPCPIGCDNGVMDSGGMTPQGARIDVPCPWCSQSKKAPNIANQLDSQDHFSEPTSDDWLSRVNPNILEALGSIVETRCYLRKMERISKDGPMPDWAAVTENLQGALRESDVVLTRIQRLYNAQKP